MEITINGKPEALYGELPQVGDQLPKFKLEDQDGNKVKTANIIGKPTLISVVPDIDTPVCSTETRKFNQQADQYPGVRFLTISNNTIEQQRNWCAAQGVKNLELLSDEELSFGYAMKTYLPNFGTLARVIFVVDQEGQIIYRQLVSELTDEPNYDEVLAVVAKLANDVDD